MAEQTLQFSSLQAHTELHTQSIKLVFYFYPFSFTQPTLRRRRRVIFLSWYKGRVYIKAPFAHDLFSISTLKRISRKATTTKRIHNPKNSKTFFSFSAFLFLLRIFLDIVSWFQFLYTRAFHYRNVQFKLYILRIKCTSIILDNINVSFVQRVQYVVALLHVSLK